MELARAWLGDNGGPIVPPEILALLDGHDLTRGFEPELGIGELVTELDEFAGEHRNHDLAVVGSAAGGRTLLAIEGKADEAFGSFTVAGYLKHCERREAKGLENDRKTNAEVDKRVQVSRRRQRPSNAPKRIGQLCRAIFGQSSDPADVVHPIANPLRYQLIAALAGLVIEAKARDCEQGVFIVHEFLSIPDPERGLEGTNPKKVKRNSVAFERFVQSLPGAPQTAVTAGNLVGPLEVPGDGRVPGELPLLVGKVTRRLT